ncbi:putative succinate dehydrogenase iron-sulfur subunit [Gordonia hirsuta DSM 44140 = NBRC 16056]|uniref:succinate dehydrogenase n=1 Tax=Gordonia hirsuta DSM 44140 = NBRC 16056 TaxID=1121927 RepID=L7L8Y0_9ACTN|nr:succinate dehydrogenase/fumarate reductase iron-sulfur subunit [Gordonia hirsuta]GAC56468.1 putative succinate dehydrogenase iron-sulfur subunit [Gordonia hirsuta DSM 44140 = NBRC 16056]
MKITIEAWRQDNADAPGRFETYLIDATPEMSLLEVLDLLNEQLVASGEEPVAFDSDCREGICGACGITVDGRPHGPVPNTPSCLQHLTQFPDPTRMRLEPLRAAAFPVVRDLAVDRSALDRVIEAGGHVGINTGQAADADAELVNQQTAETALDFAGCIGCGACVAACPNGAAHLFAGAKLLHLSQLSYGRQERGARARAIAGQLDHDFGPCSTFGECAQVCPADIDLSAVAAVNRESMRFSLRHKAD